MQRVIIQLDGAVAPLTDKPRPSPDEWAFAAVICAPVRQLPTTFSSLQMGGSAKKGTATPACYPVLARRPPRTCVSIDRLRSTCASRRRSACEIVSISTAHVGWMLRRISLPIFSRWGASLSSFGLCHFVNSTANKCAAIRFRRGAWEKDTAASDHKLPLRELDAFHLNAAPALALGDGRDFCGSPLSRSSSIASRL